MSVCFIHFGEKLFRKFDFVESTFGKVSRSLEQNFSGFVFDSLLIDSQKLKVQEVYSCWSFALFVVDDKIFHCGFKEGNVSDSVSLINHIIGDSASSNVQRLYAGWNHAVFTSEHGLCSLISDGRKLVESFKICNVKGILKQIFPARFQNIFVTEDGLVYKSDLLTSAQLLPIPKKISTVACGIEHTLMLTTAGSIYSFGVGSRGQLGHGCTSDRKEPTLVEALDGIVIKTIAAGGWHSAAISVYGDLYTWGWNESGQLGRPCRRLCNNNSSVAEVEEICCLPKLVPLKDIDIKIVSLGSRHSAVLLDDLTVWTWGWNGYGQLGYDANPCSDFPHRVYLPPHFSPQNLQCFLWSTLITATFLDSEVS